MRLQVTKVTTRPFAPGKIARGLVLVVLAICARGQEGVTSAKAPGGSPAEALYLKLQGVGLDAARVFHAREVSIDRSALHITLTDGTIAFTKDVAGHVTGAFFEGEGEVLLVPSDEVERASMTLFTGGAILEEQFTNAYFRFNDDTFNQLKPHLQAAEDAPGFLAQWDEVAQKLAEVDALRVFLTLEQALPSPDSTSEAAATKVSERMLHGRLQGRNLGTFDVYYDAAASEQIRVGSLTTIKGESFYDVWASFSARAQAKTAQESGSVGDEEVGADSVQVSAYKIRSEITLPTALKADASLQLDVRQGGQRVLIFELSRFLRIEGIEADSTPIDFIQNPALEGTQLSRRGNDLVALIFPKPLLTGQRLRLRFKYAGEVLSDAGGGLLYVGARGLWYPNRGRVMCNFDLEFHYPPGWTLVATGRRSDSVVKPQSGEQASRWISQRPILFAGFNLGRYTRATAHAGDATIETYAASGVEHSFPRPFSQMIAPPIIAPGGLKPAPLLVPPALPSPARNEQRVADSAARALEFFARRFGPYPYGSLSVTQIPGAVSQSWPGLVYLSSFAFLTPAEQADLHMSNVDKIRSYQVIAHETAHQWWGDLVDWKTYRDQWLVEGLAEYSSLMLLESQDPAAFQSVMDQFREDLLTKNKDGVPLMNAGPVTLGIRLSCSRFPAGYEGVSYERGAWLFHSLRTMMQDAESKGRRNPALQNGPDEPFVRALHRLRERFEQKSITTRDLLRVFEEELPPSLWYEGHRSLNWFYQGWINGTAIPRLELHAVKYSDSAGATVVSGILLQKDAPDTLVTSVPIYGTVSGRSILLGRVFADGVETSFRLSAPAGTRKLVADPNHTLLTRLH